MSKGTRTYVTVYEYGERDLAMLDRGVNLETDQFFEDVVPFKHEWGPTAYIELEDLDYVPNQQQLTFICETKWDAPTGWLKAASVSPYFQGKLIVAATITRDESHVEGYAFMNHDLLQERTLLHVDPAVIGEMYTNDEVDEIDEMLWGPIRSFEQECQEFYIENEG